MTKDLLLTDIDDFMNELSKPLSSAEIANGWNVKSQAVMLKFFNNLRKDIENNKPLKNLNVIGGMDYHGVATGKLLERAISLSLSAEKLLGTK